MRRTRAAIKAAVESGEDQSKSSISEDKRKRARKDTSKGNCIIQINTDPEGHNESVRAAARRKQPVDIEADVELLRARQEMPDHSIHTPVDSDEIQTLSDDDRAESNGLPIRPPCAAVLKQTARRSRNARATNTANEPNEAVSSVDSACEFIDICSEPSRSPSPLSLSPGPSVATSSTSTCSSKRSSSQASEPSSPLKSLPAKKETRMADSKSKSKRTKCDDNGLFTGIIVGAQRKLKRSKKLSAEEILALNKADSVGAATLALTSKPLKKKKVESYSFKKALDSLVPDEVVKAATVTSTNHSEMDCPLTQKQAEIADLDTDTDIESNEGENVTRTKSLKTKSQLNTLRQPATTSRPYALDELNDEYARLKERMKKGTQRVSQNTQREKIPITLSDDEDITPTLPSSATPRSSQKVSQEKDRWQQDMTQMSIRITYKGRSYPFNCKKEWDVAKLRKQLADRIGKEYDTVHIYDKNDEPMRDKQTLGFYEVDHCHVLEANVFQVAKLPISEQPKEDVVKLKFQKQGLKKPLIIPVLKMSSFEEIRLNVAKELNLESSSLRFKFDGEHLPLTETPESQEMEDDDCIDIYVD